MGLEEAEVTGAPNQKTRFRFKIRLAIFYGPGEQDLMTDYSVNMSTGGVFIESGKILPVDTPLMVEFRLPINNKLITCKARVAWVNEPGAPVKPSLPPGMGVQFLELTLENIRAIRNFLRKFDLEPTW